MSNYPIVVPTVARFKSDSSPQKHISAKDSAYPQSKDQNVPHHHLLDPESIINIMDHSQDPDNRSFITPSSDTGSSNRSMASISLTDLAHLRRLQSYHQRKRSQAEQRLQIARTSWAVRSRLIKSRRQVIGELTKALRFENQKIFLPLYQAFRTIEAACLEYDRSGSSLASYYGLETSIKESKPGSFFHQLNQASRDTLTQFIQQIACDPNFLLRHLSHLTNRELDAISTCHCLGESSVLKSYGVSKSTAYKERPNPELLDSYLELGRRDVLSLLLEIVSPDCSEPFLERSTQYWAKICAGLLLNQKPGAAGAEKFVLAVLSAWSDHQKPTGRRPLENWLIGVLKDGAFLLDKPDKHSFRMRVQSSEGHFQENTDAADAFFMRSLNDLLELVKDTSLTDTIPEACLRLGRTIVHHLRGSPKQYQTAPHFLCERWLFSSYLANLIRNPESCGLLLSHHITTNTRRRILDELVLRLRKLVSNVSYSWKHTDMVDPNLLNNIHAIVDSFRPDISQQSSQSSMHDSVMYTDRVTDAITLCPSDVLTLVQGLLPEPVANLGFLTSSFGSSATHSSASSISSFPISKNGHPEHGGSSRYEHSPANLDQYQPVGSPQEVPFSKSVPKHYLDAIEDPFDGCAQEYASQIVQLRLVCNNLVNIYGAGSVLGHDDPFLEHWATISVHRTDLSYPKTREHMRDDTTEPTPCGIIDHRDVHGIPVRLRQATDTLFDQLEAPTKPLGIRSGKISGLCVTPGHNGCKDAATALVDAFNNTASECRRTGSYVKALFYHQASNELRQLLIVDSFARSNLKLYLDGLAQNFQRHIDMDQSRISHCDNETEHFRGGLALQLSRIGSITETLSRLREKMWYINSVRYSSQYEDLSKVVSALEIMGLPSRHVSTRAQPALRRRPTGLALYEVFQLRTESTVLEALAAPMGYGGPNKLNDKQVKLTLDWLQSHGIENICKGEERLHRFCQEVSRCVNSLVGDSVSEHPVLWSSELFRDNGSSEQQGRRPSSSTCPINNVREQVRSMYVPQRHDVLPTRPSLSGPSFDYPYSRFGSPSQEPYPDTGFSMFGRPIPDRSRSCSPTLTTATSGTFWSSFTPTEHTMSSMTSVPSRPLSRPLSDRSSIGSLGIRMCQKGFLEELRHSVTSLLLSDIGGLFYAGSETDIALYGTFGGKFAKAISTIVCFQETDPTPFGGISSFNGKELFQQLLSTFELQSSAFEKVQILGQIQEMYQAVFDSEITGRHVPAAMLATQSSLGAKSVSLQPGACLTTNKAPNVDNDASIAGFRRLFLDESLRPRTLFRDLQYIASLVPADVLDTSHAFWNATIAALSIKDDIVHSMIETADAIVTHHTRSRGHSSAASPAQFLRDSATFTSSRPSSAAAKEKVSQYTMADASQLYLIAAKEGDCVAQRELATLYLTHPEIMKRTIAPLTKAEDVFKGSTAVDALRGRRGSGYGDKELDEKYDPAVMAIARHWMEMAAKGGDELAKNTLKATDEIERIPQ